MGALIHIDGKLVGTTTNQFRRYTFPLPAAATASGGRQTHTVRVTLDPRIATDGRFMGCSGGWDWGAPRFRSSLGAIAWGHLSCLLLRFEVLTTKFWRTHAAPYSNTLDGKGALTFSSGIWKAVYVVVTGQWAITHMVPTTFYRGADPTTPLSDGGDHSGFRVAVKLFVQAATTGEAAITATGSWVRAPPPCLAVLTGICLLHLLPRI